MEGAWPIIFLAVVLKIPVAFGLWLVWWAIRQEPQLDDAPGGEAHGFRRWRRQPRNPRGPRRGPHGGGTAMPLPDCRPSRRTRTVPARPLPALAGHERREHTPAGG
jgi:hypothetical protein